MTAETTPAVERAALHLNTLHRTDDLHARRREAVVAGRALLDVELVARALSEHRIECTGLEGVTCRGCRELGWMPRHAFEKHQAEAIRAALLGGAA